MVSRPPVFQGQVLAGTGWAAGGDGVAVPPRSNPGPDQSDNISFTAYRCSHCREKSCHFPPALKMCPRVHLFLPLWWALLGGSHSVQDKSAEDLGGSGIGYVCRAAMFTCTEKPLDRDPSRLGFVWFCIVVCFVPLNGLRLHLSINIFCWSKHLESLW